MSREIKFRAWDIDAKRMKPWEKMVDWPMAAFEHRDLIVEQFTGLKDKNGKDIYEGDVLQYEESKRLFFVMWYPEGAMFVAPFKQELPSWERSMHGLFRYELDRAEVIGNIHENIELLDQQS